MAYENSACTNYRIFKERLTVKSYLSKLDRSARITMSRFRCRSTELPISTAHRQPDQTLPHCTFCQTGQVADKLTFECVHFKEETSALLDARYNWHPITIKLRDIFSEMHMYNIEKFICIVTTCS